MFFPALDFGEKSVYCVGMQTFLPSLDHAETAYVLDNKRLNKQALEAWQLMLVNLKLDPEGNHREPRGWYNHPAALMWRGHEGALLEYIEAMTVEWKSRGYKTTIFDKAKSTLDSALRLNISFSLDKPRWMKTLSALDVASSHRLALLTKNYEHYRQFGWSEDPGCAPEAYEYVWLTSQGD